MDLIYTTRIYLSLATASKYKNTIQQSRAQSQDRKAQLPACHIPSKMELSSLLFPTIPVPMIVALLAGVFFLHRIWGNSFFTSNFLQSNSKLSPEDIALQTQRTGKEETPAQVVSKESDFPANWWTGKEIFDLERRALFSKVSIQPPLSPRTHF